MVLSGILIALLATLGQWWFFGPITKCLVYPLVTGTLVGVFMGDPMMGMLAGANIQLIYLGWISAGGTMPSNTIVAGVFGTAMTLLSGAEPTLAITFAIPFSMFGLLLNQVYMTVNAAWIHRADKLLEKGNLRGVRLMNYVPSFFCSFYIIWCAGILIGCFRKRLGTEFNRNCSRKCYQCFRGCRGNHASSWYCHAFELFRKEKASSMVYRRFLPYCILRPGNNGSLNIRSGYSYYLIL